MIASLIGIFTYAVYIGETNLGLLAVILITYPLIFWIAGKLVKRIRGLQANYRQKTDVMAQIAQDAVSGILVLRSFGIEDVFRKKMHRASVELVENEEKRTQITNTAIVVRKLIQWLPNIISAVYAVWLVSRGEVSLGGLVGFILILSKFVDAYTGLPFAMVDASTGMVSVDRVEKILSAEEELSGMGTADAAVLAAENVIAFDQVDFSYHLSISDPYSFYLSLLRLLQFHPLYFHLLRKLCYPDPSPFPHPVSPAESYLNLNHLVFPVAVHFDPVPAVIPDRFHFGLQQHHQNFHPHW